MQAKITGIARAGAVGKKIWDLQFRMMPKELRTPARYETHKRKYRVFLKTGKAKWLNKVMEVPFEKEDGTRRVLQMVVFPVQTGQRRHYVSFCRDVTDLRRAQMDLEERNRQLEAKNTALREVMARLEAEKKRIGDQVLSNVERLVLPLVGRIRDRGTDDDRKAIDLLEANLREITASFGGGVSGRMNRLTQKEFEIADMIRRGLSSKEIGRLLAVSHRTVETHRSRIRKKLAIDDSAVNLRTYLKSASHG